MPGPATGADLKLCQQGYEPAPEAPMWTFLPAVMRASVRAWILDTRIRQARISCDGTSAQVIPWCTAEYFEVEADANELLALCGLPSRPAGRLLLLESPPDQRSLHGTLELLVKSATVAGLDAMASIALVEHVRQSLHELFREPSPRSGDPDSSHRRPRCRPSAQRRETTSSAASCARRSLVVESGLEDDQVVAVDEVDQAVFLGDAT